MRKTEDVTITAEGRDKGKTFRITEWPATRAEKWGMRAMLALENSGFQVPDEAKGAGMAGLLAAGGEHLLGRGRLDFREFEPLLDEMLECVQIVPDPKNAAYARPVNTGGSEDTEEIPTLLQLRRKVLELHTSFLGPAFLSRLTLGTTEGAAGSSATSTSPPSSGRSSHRATRTFKR